MARGIKRKLRQVAKAVDAEIAGHAADGGLYARGLAGEGYAGGYREAISDVILALNGVKPGRRFWRDVEGW